MGGWVQVVNESSLILINGCLCCNASLYAAQLHVVAPVLSNGWAVLGEAHKFLPVAGQRVVAVDATSSESVKVRRGLLGSSRSCQARR